MKSPLLGIFALLFVCLAPRLARSAQEQPPLKLQAYQAQNFDVSKERAYNATFVVFQDLGCTISSADIQTGYISAQCPQSSNAGILLFGSSNLKLTAYVVPHGKGRSRVRVTIVRTFGWNWFAGPSDFLVKSPAVYHRLFARILETLVTEKLQGNE